MEEDEENGSSSASMLPLLLQQQEDESSSSSSDLDDLLSNSTHLLQFSGSSMPVENCTDLFENVTIAANVFNVTCLGHAPTLNNQVRSNRE